MFCGLPILATARPRSWGDTPDRADAPSPFYVSAQDAARLMELMRDSPGLAAGVPLCPGCVVNLRRANRAIGYGPASRSSSGDFGVAVHPELAELTEDGSGSPSIGEPRDGSDEEDFDE